MSNINIIEQLQIKYQALLPYLNEKTKRIWAATEALSLGYGGVVDVSRATGLSRTTIYAGIHKLENNELSTTRIRCSGGGRKLAEEKNPSITSDLNSLLESTVRGDPELPLQ